MSSLIAFQAPKGDFEAFSIVAPHGDSPSFKVKESPELPCEGHYTRLNTEVYGGPLLRLWTDRPLSVAGRLALRRERGVETRLVDLSQDLLIIPGLAPHLDRETAEQGGKLDRQKDTLPLLGGEGADLLELLAQSIGERKEDVLTHDLYLYVRQRGTQLGAKGGVHRPPPGWTTWSACSPPSPAFLQGATGRTARCWPCSTTRRSAA